MDIDKELMYRDVFYSELENKKKQQSSFKQRVIDTYKVIKEACTFKN